MYAKFARLFAIAAVALVGVNAAPAANVENLDARAAQVDGHLFVCIDINFSNTCANLNFNVNTCINFSSPFQDTISSLGPDPGFTCVAFVDANCSGAGLIVTNPGFSSVPAAFNDVLSSFRLWTLRNHAAPVKGLTSTKFSDETLHL
ncbi:hypothetical protein BJ912DRAFT_1042400 [Pholiota molesta]|nr:hypothetical protein BJ912DRAFT_1042399 [Pholiota molesta]KAF8189028.1 hypothetical protein BJ912DRAFT_1042400 [Pholiota molesta]